MEALADTKRSRRWIWASLLLVAAVSLLTVELLSPAPSLLRILEWVVLVLLCAVILLHQLQPGSGSLWIRLETALVLLVFAINVLPDLAHALRSSSEARGILLATAVLCGLIFLWLHTRRRSA